MSYVIYVNDCFETKRGLLRWCCDNTPVEYDTLQDVANGALHSCDIVMTKEYYDTHICGKRPFISDENTRRETVDGFELTLISE